MESDRIINTPQDGVSDELQRMRPPHGRTTGPTRRSTKGQWTAEEDEILSKAVQRFKGKSWKKIAECFKDRTDVQCLHRWQKVLNPELIKGPWSKEEDEVMIELVDKYGAKKWSTIAQHLPGRIGKQCRERWHNHLNPAINKEAWTQEEELALIRAHQIYGNKWAELTKFLPGRTDNSIKNHWNSSVKKKLESYLASGLLSQFPGLPDVGHQIQIMPSSSSRMQHSSEDDSELKDETKADDTSECSQGLTVVGCSQDASEMTNTDVYTGGEHLLTDDSSQGKEQRPGPASSSQLYYTSVEEVYFSIPKIPYEEGCPFLDQDFSHEAGTSANQDTQFNLHEFSNISSLELGQDGSDLLTHCVRANMKHEAVPASLQAPVGINASTIMGNAVMGSNQLEHILISEGDCCRVILPEEETDGCISSGNFQVSENARCFASQAYYCVRSDILENSCCQSLPSVPLPLSADHSRFLYGSDLNHLHDQSVGTQEHEFVARTHEDFIFTNDSASFPCDDDTGKIDPQEHSADLVPVYTLSSRPSDSLQTCPINERPIVKTEQQDTCSLFYEPPRFPSLDIPFFSCDLVQSGSDMHQEYSPLGIRQLMMSSMNCFTPFRSWDSPSGDDSPDAVLKSAAKTFTNTPSILKKRHHDLLSPLSERRSDKKIGRDFNQRSLSSLARDISHLDGMFDENVTLPSSDQKRNSKASTEYKENLDNTFKGGNVGGGDKTASSHVRISEKKFESSNSEDEKEEGGTLGNDAKIQVAADGTSQIPSGVLVEHNMNNLLFFSPGRSGSKAERVLDLSNSSNQANSSGNPYIHVVTSPTVSGKKYESMVAITSMKAAPSSTPLKILVDNARHDASIENVTITGETPFKRSIGSPPTWLSPWLFNSFLPGPRVDTEITIEDIGYFMSPGDRSYDAIGLMKQLSEHTAAAFADAQEVLGNDTPETILKERRSNNHNPDHSHLDSDILTERRVLDFSECGTPVKSKENGKSSNGINLTSPSSYLMKSCR